MQRSSLFQLFLHFNWHNVLETIGTYSVLDADPDVRVGCLQSDSNAKKKKTVPLCSLSFYCLEFVFIFHENIIYVNINAHVILK